MVFEESPAEQAHTLSVLTQASSWATLAGTLFILLSYLAFKEVHMIHMRLVFFLALADFFTAITFLINVYIQHTPLSCSILGSSLQFFELSSTLWAFCLAYVLDQVIRVNSYSVETKEKYFHLACWIVPALTVVVCLIWNLFSDTGLWCWISAIHNELFRWLFFYGPTVCVLIYVTVVYVLISRKIYRQNTVLDEAVNSADTTIQLTFRLYIIGWILCWAPAIVDRVQGLLDPTHPIFILQCLHAFLTPLAGFCNSVAIGFNDGIQTQYAALFRRMGCKCIRKRNKRSIQRVDEQALREVLREYEYSAVLD